MRLKPFIAISKHSGLLGSLLVVPKRNFRLNTFEGPTINEIHRIREQLFEHLSQEKPLLRKKFPLPKVTNKSVKTKRSLMFSEEQLAQNKDVGRIEKITVQYEGLPENATLIMNKAISTPYNCAQHLGELISKRTLVAEVDGEFWDLHRPLTNSCRMRLIHMKMANEDLNQANKIFWRSCSFMLGAALERAFKEHIYVELHSFPAPNAKLIENCSVNVSVRSGSFVYDADLKVNNWKPNSDEMRALSAEMIKLSREELPFERLEVSQELALKMFEDNQYKRQQIPEIAQSSHNQDTICLYRIGDFVDISKGPMMSNTRLLNKCTITLCQHLKECEAISKTLYRIQGVALPSELLLNHYAYGLIEKRGRKLNTSWLPGSKQNFSSPKDSVRHLESA